MVIRSAPAAMMVLGLVVACGGRVDLSVPDCSADAVTYCKANGCPLTGPAASTAGAVATWCAASPTVAPRVTAFGACTVSGGATWATNVKATDASGNLLYLLYDPTSAALLSVTTIGAGDGGKGEQDYGYCGEHSGIVSCTDAVFTCGQ